MNLFINILRLMLVLTLKKVSSTKKIYNSKHATNVLKTGDKAMRINQMNKNHKGGRLDKYKDQNIYIVQKTLSNGNIQILNMHSNKATSLPPSHLKNTIHLNQQLFHNLHLKQHLYPQIKFLP